MMNSQSAVHILILSVVAVPVVIMLTCFLGIGMLINGLIRK